MIFNANDRKTLTRRQLNLQIENAAYAKTATSMSVEQAKLLDVDNANGIFYNFYDVQVKAYEDEARGIDGKVADEYLYSDLDAAAQVTTYAPFFPDPTYIRFIPNISEYAVSTKIRGRFHPSSTDSRYEVNILNNAILQNGLTSLIGLMNNPITGSGASSTTLVTVPAGTITNQSVEINAPSTFSINDLIIIHHASGSGLYRVVNITSTPDPFYYLWVDGVIPSLTGIPATATVINSASAFSPTERQNMTHSLYNEYLNNLGSAIITMTTEWQTNLSTQLTNLNLQNDTRATQLGQNNSAKADVQSRISVTNIWLALSYTGINGQFVASNFNTLSSSVTARAVLLSTRITQIEYALGQSSGDCLIQSGDSFSTNIANNSYYNRYLWINIRINKMSGSLRRYYSADKGINQLNSLISNNTQIETQYNVFFMTKRVMASDGTKIVQLDNYTSLSVGDIVYLVSETQPEIELGIVELMGSNQVRFDKNIPNTYIFDDITRVFKKL